MKVEQLMTRNVDVCRADEFLNAAARISDRVCSCRPTDSLQAVLNVLRTTKVRRLPVLDANDHLIGMLSLADVAREADREHGRRNAEMKDADIAQTLQAISRPRSPREVVRAA